MWFKGKMRCKKTKRTQIGHLVEALNFLVKCSVLWRKEYLVQLFSRYSAYYSLKRLKKTKESCAYSKTSKQN